MAQEFAAYIGIDAGSGRKPFTYTCLDAKRKLLAVGSGSTVDVLSYAAGQTAALAAVSAPVRPGSLKLAHASEPALPVLRLGSLRQLSLDLGGQPHADASADCPPWMAASIELVDRLQSMGYLPFQAADSPLQWLEAPAQSGFQSWLGLEPFEADTLEGRLQRQLVLYDLDLDVPDAMEFFEEITRFKLLHGHLPYERVLSQAEINAYMAANTAWLAVNEPATVHSSGSAESGLVYFPVKPVR